MLVDVSVLRLQGLNSTVLPGLLVKTFIHAQIQEGLQTGQGYSYGTRNMKLSIDPCRSMPLETAAPYLSPSSSR